LPSSSAVRRAKTLGGIAVRSAAIKSQYLDFVKKSSDIAKQTPPVGKSEVWLALCEGSPADFEAEI